MFQYITLLSFFFSQKIASLLIVNQEQEHAMVELKELGNINERTPRKTLNMSLNGNMTVIGTPKTPKTPRKYPGKENQLQISGGAIVHSPNVLRARNN